MLYALCSMLKEGSMALQPNEVKTEHIANGAVTTPKIADGAITTPKLGQKIVTTEKIANAAVTAYKIGEQQVTTSRLKDAAVTSPKITNEAISTSKIAPLAITEEKIKSGAVVTEKIAAGAVTSNKLQATSVTTDKIANGAVTPSKLSFTPPSVARPITPPVTAAELAAGSVETAKIGDGQVTRDKLQAASVTPAKLSAIDAPADGETPTYNQAQAKFEWKPAGGGISRPIVPPINTDEIADAAVQGSKLQSSSVITDKIAPGAVDAGRIAPDAVTTPKIADGAVTVAKMEDRFTIAQNVLLFSNLSNASVPNTLIDLSPYTPIDTKYAMVVMTHAGVSSIAHGYDAQFYTLRTDLTAPMYRLDSGAKDFTNYLNVLIPLDSNRRFMTSVYRVGVTTAAELYLMGYIK
jgi:hypothetical protein